jgi:hypothetical protein
LLLLFDSITLGRSASGGGSVCSLLLLLLFDSITLGRSGSVVGAVLSLVGERMDAIVDVTVVKAGDSNCFND